jgi:hypothetical protein
MTVSPFLCNHCHDLPATQVPSPVHLILLKFAAGIDLSERVAPSIGFSHAPFVDVENVWQNSHTEC